MVRHRRSRVGCRGFGRSPRFAAGLPSFGCLPKEQESGFTFTLVGEHAASPFKAGDVLLVNTVDAPTPGAWVVVERFINGTRDLAPVEYEPGITQNVVGVVVWKASKVGTVKGGAA